MAPIIAAVVFVVAVIVGLTVWAVDDTGNTNRINDTFTQHCYAIGGVHATITDKDLCLSRDGRIIAYEG